MSLEKYLRHFCICNIFYFLKNIFDKIKKEATYKFMKIRITIKKNGVNLSLWEGKRKIDERAIRSERSFSQKALLGIDAILTKNKLKPKDIKKVEVFSDQDENFTTTRLAKSLANAWNLSQKKDWIK